MYIKNLSIYKSYPSPQIIREIHFKKGMNFIVDASLSADEKGNSVGKTTVLKLIDICLGAKDRKYIYTDHEINNENIILKNYICDNKIFAELIICKEFSTETEEHSLKVDLYPRGKRYIDNEKQSADDFKKLLNSIIFHNNLKTPSFRQLIKMFVRIDQKNDNDKFLRYLDSATTPVQYENIYSYLFKLNDQKLSQNILNFKQKIKIIENEITNLKKIHNIKSIDNIKQKLINSEEEIINLKKELSSLVDFEKFKEDEIKIQEIKLIYTQILDKISFLEFKHNKIQTTLKNAKQELEKNINTEVLKNLYDETKNNFVDLNKTFQELILFNKQLLQNKINYFQISLTKINQNILDLENKKEELIKKHNSIIILIKENKLDEYTKLQNELGRTSEEKGKLQQIKDIYDQLNKNLKEYNQNLEDACNRNDHPVDTIKIFNEKFTEFSKSIIKEKYFLFSTGETFPLGIDNEKTGLSTGTKKSVIASFDLAYQFFADKLNLICPKFIVHDVIETMDEYALDNIIKITNEINCQYIIAVLQEKISDNKYVKPEDIRLTLSENEKLFKI